MRFSSATAACDAMFGNRKPTPTTGTQSMPPIAPSVPAPSSGQPPRPAPVGFETVIGANTALKGELKSEANVRIDGTFDGSIDVSGNVMIGETAHITADIRAYNLSIAGAVHGNVIGHRIQIQRTGRIWGDLSAASIVTEDGAFLEGKITMNGHPAAKGSEQQALLASESNLLSPSAEDAASGEPVEVELLDDHPHHDLPGD